MALGWGSLPGFLAHPARAATAAIMIVYTVLAVQVTAITSRGIRQANEGRWFLAALQVFGVVLMFGAPYLDARGIAVLPGGEPLRYAGLAILAAGTVWRLGPMLTLRHRFSNFVARQPEHRLETGGFYARVRHPSYVGLLLQFLGQAGVFRSVVGLAAVPVLFILLRRRMNIEERFLAEEFGDEYRAYMARTARLVPGVY
jgi:protein-S-isoprenylcysteine O-methyltransferase Ste14